MLRPPLGRWMPSSSARCNAYSANKAMKAHCYSLTMTALFR